MQAAVGGLLRDGAWCQETTHGTSQPKIPIPQITPSGPPLLRRTHSCFQLPRACGVGVRRSVHAPWRVGCWQWVGVQSGLTTSSHESRVTTPDGPRIPCFDSLPNDRSLHSGTSDNVPPRCAHARPGGRWQQPRHAVPGPERHGQVPWQLRGKATTASVVWMFCPAAHITGHCGQDSARAPYLSHSHGPA